MAKVPNITLYLNKGETYEKTFYLKEGVERRGEVVAGDPIPLTGCTARMQIRPTITSDTIIVDLTTENGRITIDEPNGGIFLLVDDTTTTAITQKEEAKYDLETICPGGIVKRRFEGTVVISEEVTR